MYITVSMNIINIYTKIINCLILCLAPLNINSWLHHWPWSMPPPCPQRLSNPSLARNHSPSSASISNPCHYQPKLDPRQNMPTVRERGWSLVRKHSTNQCLHHAHHAWATHHWQAWQPIIGELEQPTLPPNPRRTYARKCPSWERDVTRKRGRCSNPQLKITTR